MNDAVHTLLRERLAELARGGLMREPDDALTREAPGPRGQPWLDACSNDYLGLGARNVSRETLGQLEGARFGAGASRLVQGTFAEHREVESGLAEWLGAEASLLTVSAYAANVGLLPALAAETDSLLISDSLNHASIVDGCRLARARVVVTPHLDLEAVRAALAGRSSRTPAWVVTEGCFSMDGDQPDLVALRELCDQYGAGLLVDEAHSLGVLGPRGAGLGAATGVLTDATVLGFGKALGAQGGAIVCSRDMRTLLWNRARSFVFSTAPAPLLCRLLLWQLRAAQAAEPERARLRALGAELRAALLARGVPVKAQAEGPIVPVVLGSNERALAAMRVLRARGILAQAIRPPTVPIGEARLRVTLHADWPEDAVARLVDALVVACAS